MSSSSENLIGLDGDGVLIDYHLGYAMAWEAAFGYAPKVRNPLAYHPRDYWDVPELDKSAREHLRLRGFTEEVWEAMPMLPGADTACELMVDAGFSLVCITALPPSMGPARQRNLQRYRLPIAAVHAVGPLDSANPKQELINTLKPKAFVDDLLPYLQGIEPGIWRALIPGRPELSPNEDLALEQPDGRYATLLDFATYWVSRHRA